jgi:hypothetical protein
VAVSRAPEGTGVKNRRGQSHDGVREVRIAEETYLARPELWSREGLEAYLREQGIDPGRPYARQEIFVQLDELDLLDQAA